MWGETPEDPERNDALRLEGMDNDFGDPERNGILRLDDDFGDGNPERNDILRLDGGMRESEIVNTY